MKMRFLKKINKKIFILLMFFFWNLWRKKFVENFAILKISKNCTIFVFLKKNSFFWNVRLFFLFFFLISIRKIFLVDVSRKKCFDHFFMSKTLFLGFDSCYTKRKTEHFSGEHFFMSINTYNDTVKHWILKDSHKSKMGNISRHCEIALHFPVFSRYDLINVAVLMKRNVDYSNVKSWIESVISQVVC